MVRLPMPEDLNYIGQLRLAGHSLNPLRPLRTDQTPGSEQESDRHEGKRLDEAANHLYGSHTT